MIKTIKNWLIEPAIRNTDVDSPEITIIHRQLLQKKKLLRLLFENFYKQCRDKDTKYFKHCASHKVLEIGSGSSFIKEVYPDIITSDIKPLPFTDIVCDATRLPFQDNELRAIYGLNVFHHIPDPRAFFKEIIRAVAPGGGVILIEPYYGPLARKLFSNMHESEGFYPDVPNWESISTGPMSNANQALAYVVFKRDRAIFEKEFPELEIVSSEPHTQLWHLLSGGVTFRQLVPDSFARLVIVLEKLLSPFNKLISLQHTVVIRKKISAE